MMNNGQLEPDQMNEAQRAAWQASWTADEQMVAYFPAGYRAHLIIIACAKRWLLGELSVGERVEMLQWLNDQVWGIVTAAAVAHVEPANDTFMAIVYEAMKLDAGRTDDHCPDAFKMLERWSVFWDLCRLNPSMLRAIRLCGRQAVAV
jgi:hypothetical protein